MAQGYAKAPITEATVEFRLSEALTDRELSRLGARFKKGNWKSDDLAEISVRVGVTSEILQNPIGHKYTSADGRYVIQQLRKSLVVSRNAPYCGWDDYIAFVRDQYSRWRKVIGHKSIERIGVRYINRIDIPFDGKEHIDPQDYFRFLPRNLEILDAPPLGWHAQVLSTHSTNRISVTLTTATVEPVLIDHISVLLDCDMYRFRVDVPQADDQIWSFLDLVRESKNEIFEACITDSTRQLIS
ncbi:TIGR04255 family protein [Bosea sp. NPDC003192]|uniref:TIGR04255 family protein n=1 Tax=Bosea sp. NPDC003192 TaxID=3390551 RepID=UPI003D04C78C